MKKEVELRELCVADDNGTITVKHEPIEVISARIIDNVMNLGEYVGVEYCRFDRTIKLSCPEHTQIEVVYKTNLQINSYHSKGNKHMELSKILDKIDNLSFHFDRCLRQLKDELYGVHDDF